MKRHTITNPCQVRQLCVLGKFFHQGLKDEESLQNFYRLTRLLALKHGEM